MQHVIKNLKGKMKDSNP